MCDLASDDTRPNFIDEPGDFAAKTQKRFGFNRQSETLMVR